MFGASRELTRTRLLKAGRGSGQFAQTSLLACNSFRRTYHLTARLSLLCIDMADSPAERRSSRPKSRQSISHMPSIRPSALKDNATTDIAALQAQHSVNQAAKKRSRGKSLGPGGLESLKEPAANAAKVVAIHRFREAHC